MEKRTCKNDSRFTFTGKESSPRGLGFCAEAEVVGTRMEGRDKTHWMVIIKNGVHVWTRVPTELVPEEPIIKGMSEMSLNPEPSSKKRLTLAIPEEEEGMDGDTTDSTPPTPHEQDASRPASPVKPKPKPKPKAPPKAKDATPKPEAKPKSLTDFHYYMKYRMATLAKEAPDMPNRFSQAAKDWKALTPETKKEVVAKARELYAS